MPKRGIPKRIVALKSFSKWLRQGGDSVSACLKRKDDWTLDLAIPKQRRVKSIEEKTYSVEHLETIYRHISPRSYKAGSATRESDAQSVRDEYRIAVTTGLHLREIDRVARQRDEAGHLVGKVERLENQPPPIYGAITVWHKNGVPHKIAIDQATCEAALRLQARGSAPEKRWVHKVLDRAAAAAGVPQIEPGSLRHSFISLGNSLGTVVRVNGSGAGEHVMAGVANHSLATSRKHYKNSVEPLIVLPLKLEHSDDPMPQESPRKPLKVAG